MTPKELLESAVVHSTADAAIILGFRSRDGKPRSDVVRSLIRSGALRVVDPDQPVSRWTVSSAELERYISAGGRKGADIVPIRSAS